MKKVASPNPTRLLIFYITIVILIALVLGYVFFSAFHQNVSKFQSEAILAHQEQQQNNADRELIHRTFSSSNKNKNRMISSPGMDEQKIINLVVSTSSSSSSCPCLMMRNSSSQCTIPCTRATTKNKLMKNNEQKYQHDEDEEQESSTSSSFAEPEDFPCFKGGCRCPAPECVIVKRKLSSVDQNNEQTSIVKISCELSPYYYRSSSNSAGNEKNVIDNNDNDIDELVCDGKDKSDPLPEITNVSINYKKQKLSTSPPTSFDQAEFELNRFKIETRKANLKRWFDWPRNSRKNHNNNNTTKISKKPKFVGVSRGKISSLQTTGGHDHLDGIYRWNNICIRSEGAPFGFEPKHEKFHGVQEYHPLRGGSYRMKDFQNYISEQVEKIPIDHDEEEQEDGENSEISSNNNDNENQEKTKNKNNNKNYYFLDAKVIMVPLDYRSEDATHLLHRLISARRIARHVFFASNSKSSTKTYQDSDASPSHLQDENNFNEDNLGNDDVEDFHIIYVITSTWFEPDLDPPFANGQAQSNSNQQKSATTPNPREILRALKMMYQLFGSSWSVVFQRPPPSERWRKVFAGDFYHHHHHSNLKFFETTRTTAAPSSRSIGTSSAFTCFKQIVISQTCLGSCASKKRSKLGNQFMIPLGWLQNRLRDGNDENTSHQKWLERDRRAIVNFRDLVTRRCFGRNKNNAGDGEDEEKRTDNVRITMIASLPREIQGSKNWMETTRFEDDLVKKIRRNPDLRNLDVGFSSIPEHVREEILTRRNNNNNNQKNYDFPVNISVLNTQTSTPRQILQQALFSSDIITTTFLSPTLNVLLSILVMSKPQTLIEFQIVNHPNYASTLSNEAVVAGSKTRLLKTHFMLRSYRDMCSLDEASFAFFSGSKKLLDSLASDKKTRHWARFSEGRRKSTTQQLCPDIANVLNLGANKIVVTLPSSSLNDQEVLLTSNNNNNKIRYIRRLFVSPDLYAKTINFAACLIMKLKMKKKGNEVSEKCNKLILGKSIKDWNSIVKETREFEDGMDS